MNINKILVPRGTLDSEEMEMVAAKLFKCGYSVRKLSITSGENKGCKAIQFWIDGGDKDVPACENGIGQG